MTTEKADNKTFVKVEVEDTGIGIKDEDKGKLFKLFGFLDETKVINTSGIGLGLVISEKLVTLLGGEISFTSEFGKGSVFCFTLPIKTNRNLSLLNSLSESISRSESEEDLKDEDSEFQLNSTELLYKWSPVF